MTKGHWTSNAVAENYVNRERDFEHPDIIGQRAWYLTEARKIERDLGFSTSNFTVIPESLFEQVGIDLPESFHDSLPQEGKDFRSVNSRLVDYFAQKLHPHIVELEQFASPLAGQDIIVRPSPLDEGNRMDLSFAGVFKGYMPLRPGLGRTEHLLYGTAAMLAGRFTDYSGYYHTRHDIQSRRKVGAILMEPFFNLQTESPLLHGTAYVLDDHIRNEYNVTPEPGMIQRDSDLIVERGRERWYSKSDVSLEASLDFPDRITTALKGLRDYFKHPLDVEYLVDPKGDLYIVQLRPISERHLNNWKALPQIDEAGLPHRTAIINSIGGIEGRVVDLRDSTNDIGAIDSNSILVINHERIQTGMDTETLCKLMAQYSPSNLRVIIDHGDKRARDHLQYAVAEDPSIDFLVQTSDPSITQSLRHGEEMKIISNGIECDLQ
ncbi:MAG TPA: hypothetical protein VFZ58_05405 [Candidatus Saccharimonadales bacterium]